MIEVQQQLDKRQQKANEMEMKGEEMKERSA